MRSFLIAVAATALWSSLLTSPAAAADTTTAGKAGARPKNATFVVASFNALGSSHTAPGGSKGYMASGITRTHRTVALLQRHNIDVVGLQEFQRTQLNAFVRRTKAFNVFPGIKREQRNKQNAVAWRTSKFKLVNARTRTIPYFGGHRVPIPIVRLKDRRTGAHLFVISVHNAATTKTHGNQRRWRDAAMRIEIALTKQLLVRHKIPVFMTGDMNERERFFCAYTRNGRMHAAAGGSHVNGRCKPPPPQRARIDWVFGSRAVTFSNYAYLRTPLVRSTSDHPLIRARARIPAPR